MTLSPEAPEQSGSFCFSGLSFELRMTSSLPLGRGDESKRQSAGCGVGHGIDNDFRQNQIRPAPGAHGNHLLQAAEWHDFFGVIRRVGLDEDRLADCVRW